MIDTDSYIKLRTIMKKRFVSVSFLALILLASCVGVKSDKQTGTSEESSQSITDDAAAASEDSAAAFTTDSISDYDGKLHEEDGMMQPMLKFASARDEDYSNEKSEIIRYCVYVETDHDTDGDGKDDLVKVLVQIPRGAAEGDFKAGVIYDPTPYGAGTVEENDSGAQNLYVEKEFDYRKLYKKGSKRTPAGEIGTMEAAGAADPEDWNYKVPVSFEDGMSYTDEYDYYLVRGFAVVEASGIGTYGSEGFELCGTDLERDSHKAVVEWLTGERRAFSDKDNNFEVKADWSNGKVAMTGCSYGGTLPFEVATTGVKGLETIIPYAGIASWYDYTNSQGVATTFDNHYTDYLSAYNCGGIYLDDDWTVPDENYCSWLWQISQDESRSNGDYSDIWKKSDYSGCYKNIKCSALIVHGLNDFNVTTKQADLMYQAFAAAGRTVKLVFHQDGHNTPYDKIINGELWQETVNKWLSHYLYDVDNGIENRPVVTVQSNLDGTFKSFETWRDFHYSQIKIDYKTDITQVSSKGFAGYTYDYFGGAITNGYIDEGYTEVRDDYYMSLEEPNSAVYDIKVPENSTIYGVPEVHLKLKTDNTDLDGMMISAVLIDTSDNGEKFSAYQLKSRLHDTLPKKTVGTYEFGGGLEDGNVLEFVQSKVKNKCISFGWTDLCNPGLGYDSSEYCSSTELEAGKYYDYTLYMLPSVYTIAKGHSLKLVLMTWDPYRAFLDEDFMMNPDNPSAVSEYDYSYTIDNKAICVNMPFAGE